MSQTYEEKELIVVDSGHAASPFFSTLGKDAHASVTYVHVKEELTVGHSSFDEVFFAVGHNLHLPSNQLCVAQLCAAMCLPTHFQATCGATCVPGYCTSDCIRVPPMCWDSEQSTGTHVPC